MAQMRFALSQLWFLQAPTEKMCIFLDRFKNVFNSVCLVIALMY